MAQKSISYSSESVPSSCECHAGNWSESYDGWEKWKQKQCKPGFLNLQYGLNQEGTKFRKGHEPQWYKEEQARKGKAQSESVEDDSYREYGSSVKIIEQNRQKRQHRKKYKHVQAESRVKSQQHIPHPMGYPQNPMFYPQQAMGYPPVYYPHQMQPNIPQNYQYNPIDYLAHEKLRQLQNEIQELKARTTESLWEQYLKLKAKFEPLKTSSPTTSTKEKFESYRRVEKREPFYSKIHTNVYQQRPQNPLNQSKYFNNRARVQFNEQNRRPNQCNDIYRQNPFLCDGQKSEIHEDVNQLFQRVTCDDIGKNDQFNLFKKPRFRMYGSHYKYNFPASHTYNYRRDWQTTPWSWSQSIHRPYQPRYSYTQSSFTRVSETLRQNVNCRISSKSRPQITRTYPPPSPPSTTLNVNVEGEKTTENALNVYRKYKEQYEFPDYNAEKRRLLRLKEKEAKRLLYKARGLEYDEGPRRITTRPTTTAYSKYTFENMMEYYKWMFGDQSLPLETGTKTVFNNAPTFDMGHEDGQRAYLKWLMDDKSLEIDPDES